MKNLDFISREFRMASMVNFELVNFFLQTSRVTLMWHKGAFKICLDRKWWVVGQLNMPKWL